MPRAVWAQARLNGEVAEGARLLLVQFVATARRAPQDLPPGGASSRACGASACTPALSTPNLPFSVAQPPFTVDFVYVPGGCGSGGGTGCEAAYRALLPGLHPSLGALRLV